mgnify:CR=1 FL=1
MQMSLQQTRTIRGLWIDLLNTLKLRNANWRINSVWHDAKECPERKRNYLAQCKNGRFNVIPDSMNWDNFYKKAEIIRWAYIEDLLPNMED